MTDTPPATPLRLFNSLTRQTMPFVPVHAGEARVYSCGPTVYNYPHIGNMRAYVFADTLGRVLSYKGYKLTHVINITDVGHLTDDGDAGEDKLEKAASEGAQSIWDIARHYTEAYWADVKALNIRGPMKTGKPEAAHWSIATDYVPAMIDYAKGIADKHCYELESGLYFDTSTVADYGRLARAVTEDGTSRITPVDGKRHAGDFAIWRKTPPGESRQMEWDSPWGKGAPGWHLECSVMSEALLGLPFDIHTGGIDHREIHHPNEIAQNQAHSCSDASGATIWMHNNFLIDRTGKMSKSSGEFLRLQLLIDKGFHPLAYRLMCLQAHYRSELEFSWEGLQAAFVRLKRMVISVSRFADSASPLGPEQWQYIPDDTISRATLSSATLTDQGFVLPELPPAVLRAVMQLNENYDAALSDDLNTPIALAVFDEFVSLPDVHNLLRRDFAEKVQATLGLDLTGLTRADLRIRPKAATISEDEIEAALTERKDARAAKDYAASDRIRGQLAAQGVEVMDGDPLGWDWRIEL